MKNILNASLLLIAFLASFTLVEANALNFNARISDGSSYLTGTSFMDGPFQVSSGSYVDIETIVQSKAGSGSITYTANSPSGFTYVGPYSYRYPVGTGACAETGIQSTANIFKFVTPDTDCIIEVYTRYLATSAGTKNINILADNTFTTSLLSTIIFNVTTNNTITSASTFSTLNNGYINGYYIKTAAPSDINSLSGLLIDTTSKITPTVTSSGGSTTDWLLTFPTGTFSTESLPQILGNFSGYSFDDNTVQEVDKTSPTVILSNTGGTYSSARTMTLSMTESGSIYYSTTGSTLNLYTGSFLINSNTTLNIKSIDKVFNEQTVSYSYNFVCSNTVPANATIGAYPACSIQCVSGYHLNGSVCDQDSGSTGGNGGSVSSSDYCPTGDLSGNSYDGKCNASNTGTGSTNSGTGSQNSTGSVSVDTILNSNDYDINFQAISDISLLDLNTLDKTYFKNLNAATNYLTGKIADTVLLQNINTYHKALTFDGIGYFVTYDTDFMVSYNSIINKYVLLFLRLDNFKKGDTSAENKSAINKLQSELKIGIELVKSESKLEKPWFIDITSTFAQKDIIYLAIKKIVKGFEGNQFFPERSITRAEFLGIIMKAFGIQVDENVAKSSFTDVTVGGEWMIKYLEKAKDFGIKGQVINKKLKFRPNDSISRAEAMAMLFSISKITVTNPTTSSFADIPIGGEWMIEYLEKAKELGFANGQIIDSKLKFRPNDSISRAESTRILTKSLFYTRYNK